jgi:RimJ/RimL family protein N-acetyltransferase
MNQTPFPEPAVLRAAKPPEMVTLDGRYIRIERLDPQTHTDALWQRLGGATQRELWRYMSDGPFEHKALFDADIEAKANSLDPLYFAIVDRNTGFACGRAALLRIDPKNAVIEVGAIVYSPEFQHSRGATESMYLFARYVFESLGYRRYEWKCNALNEASRRAAERLGFHFEGTFRQHMIVKGKNRDTAWYSMLDSEWPMRKLEFERWLDKSNFDAEGKQRTRLAR